MGFKPFKTDRTKSRYLEMGARGEEGRKPRCDDVGVKRFDMDMEMLVRVRDILADGVDLALMEVSVGRHIMDRVKLMK